MPILDELKKKANGKADSANNIEEAVSLMDFSEGGGGESRNSNVDTIIADNKIQFISKGGN